jgi:C-type mannose receptor
VGAAFVVDLPPAADRPTRYLLPICDADCRGDACPQRCIDAAPRTVVRFRGHARPPLVCDDPTAPAHGFVCVDAAQCEQRTGCFYREFRGSAYLACGFRIAWAEASAFCEQFGGHLLTLETSEEEAFLLDQGFDGWIGLNDQLEEGRFVWANGSTADYRNWNTPFSGSAIREEDCAVMKRHPRRIWVLDPCEDNKPFICEARFE